MHICKVVSLTKLLVVLAASAALWAALAAFAYAESVTSFAVEYTVHADSSVTVKETISYDFGDEKRRGIYRDVLSQHQQPASRWYKERYVKLSPISVTRNGAPEPFVNEVTDGLFLRIGNPDVYITGEQVYDIVYTMDGALSQYPDGITELYWNVTGAEWEVPIQNVSVAVKTADEVQLATQQTCYAGVVSVNAPCAHAEVVDVAGEPQARFYHPELSSGQQLTIAQAVKLSQPPITFERVRWAWIVPCLVLLVSFGLGWVLYRWKTKYKLQRPVVAQYEPYNDFKPMFTGVLLDNRLDPRDITAGIVYLAQQGFIKITQTSEKVFLGFETHDYEVTLLKPLAAADSRFQQDLLTLIFTGQASVTEMAARPRFLGIAFGSPAGDVDSAAVGKTVRLSDIKKNQPKLRANFKVIQKLKRATKEDLVAKGFLEQYAGLFTRRTRRGYEALNHLQGFKLFLSTTEKERYTFHNAPKKNPEQFMEFLPYAIAFGVEKEWAAVFADMQISDPDWYQTDVAGSHFSAVAFSNEMSSFSSSLASSSGSSGSSGGGSAGGGGGGGGGGSW